MGWQDTIKTKSHVSIHPPMSTKKTRTPLTKSTPPARVCFMVTDSGGLGTEIFHGCLDAFRYIPGVRLTSLPFREGGIEVARKWKPSLAIAHVQQENQVKMIRHADEQVQPDMKLPDPFGQTINKSLSIRIVSEQTSLWWPDCDAVAS